MDPVLPACASPTSARWTVVEQCVHSEVRADPQLQCSAAQQTHIVGSEKLFIGFLLTVQHKIILPHLIRCVFDEMMPL